MFLRKYMSSMALLDLFMNRRLYFHPLHKFEDQWEGLPTPRELATLLAAWPPSDDYMTEEDKGSFFLLGRHVGAACCWHEGDGESIAMWKIYAGTGQGCCVVGQKEALIAAVGGSRGFTHFPVQYVDRDTHVSVNVPLPSLGYFAQFKDCAYESEKEYRFIHLGEIKTKQERREDGALITKPDYQQTLSQGVYLTAEPEKLIEKVILSPFLRGYEEGVIRQVIEVVTSGKIRVERSRLKVG
jgi:hypothetical protein